MLQSFWKKLPGAAMAWGKQPEKRKTDKVAIVGIGNEFNGDDAVGVLVVRKLKNSGLSGSSRIYLIDAGVTPENIIVGIRSFGPDVVILVDAAQMNASPGDIAWVSWDSVTGMSASSHSLPLSLLANYLISEFGCTVLLLGIQPANIEAFTPATPDIISAVDQVCDYFLNEFFAYG